MYLTSKRAEMAAQRLEFGAGNVGGVRRGEHAAQAHWVCVGQAYQSTATWPRWAGIGSIDVGVAKPA